MIAEEPDTPNVVHGDPVAAKGFTLIPNEVMLDRNLSPEAKLVYGYLKYLAWRARGSDVPITRELISEDLSIGVKQVTRAMKELGDAILVTSNRQGQGKPNVYTIFEPRSRTAESTFLGGQNGLSTRERDPYWKEDVEPKKDPPISPPAVPTPANRPKEVDRKKVTDREYDLASAILAEFNVEAGTHFESVENVKRIILRIREHPKLELHHHVRVIQTVLHGKKWWEGNPEPRIIYGNAAIFERHCHDAARPAPDRVVTGDDLRNLARELQEQS